MTRPLFGWLGGKRRLADEIMSFFPMHECYVEPFCGAAALFFMKKPIKVEVLNDINGDIINLFRVVKYHHDELKKQFDWSLVSRQEYDRFIQLRSDELTDIQRAAKFLYLQKLSFGTISKESGKFYGTTTTVPPKLNLSRLDDQLNDINYRLLHCNIEHLTWDKIVEKYDRKHTFFYCDPPYWACEGDYDTAFTWDQYELLATCMGEIDGKMILSINEHDDIQKLFEDFSCIKIAHSHGLRTDRKKKCTEFLYSNWEGDKQDKDWWAWVSKIKCR